MVSSTGTLPTTNEAINDAVKKLEALWKKIQNDRITLTSEAAKEARQRSLQLARTAEKPAEIEPLITTLESAQTIVQRPSPPVPRSPLNTSRRKPVGENSRRFRQPRKSVRGDGELFTKTCMSPASLLRIGLVFALFSAQLFAQAPAPTAPPKPKPTAPPVLDKLGIKLIPQPGVTIAEGDRSELQAGVTALGKEIVVTRAKLKDKPELLALLPDVQVFHKAVDWALRYNEFFNVKQVGTAKQLLELGNQRLAELKAGKPSWNLISGADGKPTADGKDKIPAMVVHGYLSKIDGSIQPYGIVLPEDYRPGEKTPRRLDFWCHGRGETLSELDFVSQRLTNKGEFTPPGTITLHLYGRYCCANKFAGEVDLFEALENAKTHYNIDMNKLVVRGFSMGGGAVWQFGTHFAGMWAAVQPGAGFGETREFMKLGTTPERPIPPAWEQKLWHWYDSTDYVANLANTTTVAYSGEIDGQKQAADIMIRYARRESGNANPPVAELNKVNPGDGSPSAAEARVTGTAPDVAFYHVIGLQVPHKIKAEAKPEVEKLVEAGVAKSVATPKKVRLVTYSLVYPEQDWLIVLGMEREWERAEITAEAADDGVCRITTKNVTRFALLRPEESKRMLVDGQDVQFPAWKYPRLAKIDGKWNSIGNGEENVKLDGKCFYLVQMLAPFQDRGKKNVTTCGPIDHAFMSSFLFVRPTGKPLNDKVGAWATGELEHATGFWRKVFRGEAPVKNDTAITDDDIKNSNLVLWGDPSSNAVLKKIADKLPVKWDAKSVVFAGQAYDAAHTAPVLIFPNPLNPSKYVVINSGVTFREQALLNNADQTPKLPDWAIIDLNTPPDGKWPGEVKAAGFFDEQWKAPGK